MYTCHDKPLDVFIDLLARWTGHRVTCSALRMQTRLRTPRLWAITFRWSGKWVLANRRLSASSNNLSQNVTALTKAAASSTFALLTVQYTSSHRSPDQIPKSPSPDGDNPSVAHNTATAGLVTGSGKVIFTWDVYYTWFYTAHCGRLKVIPQRWLARNGTMSWSRTLYYMSCSLISHPTLSWRLESLVCLPGCVACAEVQLTYCRLAFKLKESIPSRFHSPAGSNNISSSDQVNL